MNQNQLNKKLVERMNTIYECIDDLKKIEEIVPDYSREKYYEKLSSGANQETRTDLYRRHL